MKTGVYFADGNFFVRVDRADEDNQWEETLSEATQVVVFQNDKVCLRLAKDCYTRERLLQLHNEVVAAVVAATKK